MFPRPRIFCANASSISNCCEQELARTKQWLAETQSGARSADPAISQAEGGTGGTQSLGRINWRRTDAAPETASWRCKMKWRRLRAATKPKSIELEAENRSQDRMGLGHRSATLRTTKASELVECVRLLETAETTVVERTHWAQSVEAQRQELAAAARSGVAFALAEIGPETQARPSPESP